MSRRTNSAVWQEAYSRWRVAVQKDGQRRVRLDEVRELYTCKHNLSRFLR